MPRTKTTSRKSAPTKKRVGKKSKPAVEEEYEEGVESSGEEEQLQSEDRVEGETSESEDNVRGEEGGDNGNGEEEGDEEEEEDEEDDEHVPLAHLTNVLINRKERHEKGHEGKKQKTASRLFFNALAEEQYKKWIRRKLTETKVLNPNSIGALGIEYVLSYFRPHYLHNLITLDEPSHRDEVLQFYSNLGQHSKNMSCTMVNGKIIPVDRWVINEMLDCPYKSPSDLVGENPEDRVYNVFQQYDWPAKTPNQPIDVVEMGRRYFKIKGIDAGTANQYDVDELSIEHRLIFEWICFNVLPSGGHVSEPNRACLLLFYYIVSGLKINPGYVVEQYMSRASEMKVKKFPYGGLITRMIKKKGVLCMDPPILVEYYDEGWFDKKMLEFDEGTGKYKIKTLKPGAAARAAKRRRETEEASSSRKYMKTTSIPFLLHV